MLNRLLADVFVFTDHMSGPEAGLSPGYGVTLVAETTTGRHISAEAVAAAETMVRHCSVLPMGLLANATAFGYHAPVIRALSCRMREMSRYCRVWSTGGDCQAC